MPKAGRKMPTAKSVPAKPVAAVSPVAPALGAATAPKLPTPEAATPVQLGVPASMPVEAVVPVAPVAASEPVITAEPVVTASAIAPVQPLMPVPANQGTTAMNDTFTKIEETTTTAVNDATAKAGAFFNDANGRAKDAMAKGTKAIEELVEFSKGNLEALAASGRVAAKGAEEIAKYSAEYGRSTIEKANATARQFAAVKSPTEFFQLQGDIAKSTLDALVAEGSKFTESYLKLLGEVSQPISNRVAIAVDKVKTSVVA